MRKKRSAAPSDLEGERLIFLLFKRISRLAQIPDYYVAFRLVLRLMMLRSRPISACAALYRSL